MNGFQTNKINNSSYPTLKQFQTAHRKLIQEYIGAIDFASRLSFFINITRVLIPHEKETTFESRSRKLLFIYKYITWRPFTHFLVEAHVKAKMKELRVAYQQLILRLPTSRKYNQLRDELKSAIMECNQLSSSSLNASLESSCNSGWVSISLFSCT